MTTKKRAAVTVVLFCVIVCFAFLPAALSGEKITLKFSWSDPLDPMKQSVSAYAVTFKSELERLSGGRIEVELYPANQLGDQKSCIEQVSKGTQDITHTGSGVMASLYYDKLGIVDMPFLFDSREHAARALDLRNPIIAEMNSELIGETGVRILALVPFAPRHITNNKRPIRSPADMRGLKIRTMEIIPHMKLMESLGASPTPIPYIELYTSLQTNVVDGQENPLQNIEIQRFYQVQKSLTITGHVMGVGGTYMNQKRYETLPDDLKVALIEAHRVAEQSINGMGNMLDLVGIENLAKQGMQIHTPTQEEAEEFRKIAVPYVREYMEEELGKEFVGRFMQSVKDAKQSIVKEAMHRY